ncbi:hypothetical protein LCGC14_1888750, partial [marine sediment metagenome]
TGAKAQDALREPRSSSMNFLVSDDDFLAFDHYPCQAKDPVMPQQTEVLELRTLNVVVPAEVYWHVRKCATESRLSMKEYMAKFCREAWPYSPEDLNASKDNTAGPRESS